MKMKKIFDDKILQVAKMIDSMNFENKQEYCRWMNQQYYLVQNSSRYLALAASRVPVGESSDFRGWAHHLNEEIDHDLCLITDMKSLGWTHLEPIYPEVRAIIAAQYYDLEVKGPDSLYGYALLLEGLSVLKCADLYKKVEQAHGKKATFLRLHATVDQDHYPEGIAKVESLSSEKQTVVLDNLSMMSSLYMHFLTRLITEAKNQQQFKDAA